MNKSKAAVIAVIAVLAASAAYAAFYYLSPSNGAAGKYDSLTRCLTEKGAIMYGQEGCHACLYQEELLGDSYKNINVVDCISNMDVCRRQMIGATPTWVINGATYVGVQTPEELANESGCTI
jgi:hypothetical protein